MPAYPPARSARAISVPVVTFPVGTTRERRFWSRRTTSGCGTRRAPLWQPIMAGPRRRGLRRGRRDAGWNGGRSHCRSLRRIVAQSSARRRRPRRRAVVSSRRRRPPRARRARGSSRRRRRRWRGRRAARPPGGSPGAEVGVGRAPPSMRRSSPVASWPCRHQTSLRASAELTTVTTRSGGWLRRTSMLALSPYLVRWTARSRSCHSRLSRPSVRRGRRATAICEPPALLAQRRRDVDARRKDVLIPSELAQHDPRT